MTSRPPGRPAARRERRRDGGPRRPTRSSPAAILAHAIPGRARLRVAECRGDAEWFERVRTALEGAPHVNAIAVNPATASLLVEHSGPLEPLLDFAATHQLFHIGPEAPPPAADPRIARLLGTPLDRQNGMALLLAALGTLQLTRGQVLPAGVTMLTEAYKLFFGVTSAPRGESPTDDGDGDGDGE